MKNFKIEIKWALIFVIISLLWMFLERLFGLHGEHIDKHPIYTNFFAIPAIAIYIFALLDKSNNFYHGSMTYRQGFITGLIITLIVTVLSPITQYIPSFLITPEYFPNVIEYSVESGMMDRSAAEETFNYRNYVMQGLIFAPVMGIATSAIGAFFTRKKGSGDTGAVTV